MGETERKHFVASRSWNGSVRFQSWNLWHCWNSQKKKNANNPEGKKEGKQKTNKQANVDWRSTDFTGKKEIWKSPELDVRIFFFFSFSTWEALFITATCERNTLHVGRGRCEREWQVQWSRMGARGDPDSGERKMGTAARTVGGRRGWQRACIILDLLNSGVCCWVLC